MPQTTQGQAVGEAFASGGGGYAPFGSGSAVGEAFAAAKSTIIETYDSALDVLALGDHNPRLKVSEFLMYTLGAIPARYELMSTVAVLALTQQSSKHAYFSQLAVLAPAQGTPVDQASQLSVLTLARTDPGKRQIRVFPFNMDGHTFGVVQLGDIGTIVYDQTTGKWSEWKTELRNTWRANYGINWQSGIIAGSNDSNMIYDVDPNYSYDDLATPIVSIVTGGYPMRLRTNIACDEIMVTTSVGYSQYAPNCQLGLRISDDRGLTFRDCGTLDLTAATPQTEVSWRSLGQISQPGRIFELTDFGGAAKSFNSMEMFSRDIQDG